MHALCFCLPTNYSEFAVNTVVADLDRVCHIGYVNFFPVLLAMNVVSNTVNAVVLIRVQLKHSPTPSRLYLFWLAVTHCLTCIPVLVGASVRNRTNLPRGWAFYFAHIEVPLYNSLNCTCVFIIVGLSLDRYMAMIDLHKYSSLKEFRNVPRRIIFAYVCPLIIYTPMCFVHEPELNESGIDWRISDDDSPLFSNKWFKTWAVISQFLHRLIPACLLTLINVRLLLALKKVSEKRSQMHKRSISRSRRDGQLVHILFALTIIFIITSVPSGVLYIIYVVTDKACEINPSGEIVRIVGNCLEMAGYSCDFFLYFLINREYRMELRLIYKAITKPFSAGSAHINTGNLESNTGTNEH
ncbi:probable G-protein coupled receptor AH9.1 [Hyalella azteca]|uniref:Probable G-protein coupled receptor AH9.1 n=1 Tax=Hyalella azteca TaxID=294128 RepID=A0A8B7P6J6_HYAAZ|nr:probable G-protein coupled receptor AH9.1 [Hyalella azteca]